MILDFEDDTRAVFDDMRNFGRFQVYRSEQDLLERRPQNQNPSVSTAMQERFPQARFEQLLDLPVSRHKPLGESLTSSRVVADIGNIYKSEILFVAKLNPNTTGNQLSSAEKRRLGRAIRLVLKRAYENDGITVENAQSFSGVGEARDLHYVYGKEG